MRKTSRKKTQILEGNKPTKPEVECLSNCSSSVQLIEPKPIDIISIVSSNESLIDRTLAGQERRRLFFEHWTNTAIVVDARPCACTGFEAFRAAYLERYPLQVHTTIHEAWRSLNSSQRLPFHAEAFVAVAMSGSGEINERDIREYFGRLSDGTDECHICHFR